jgi:hypothetical protein
MLYHAVWNAHVAFDDSAVGMWCYILFYASMDSFIKMSWLYVHLICGEDDLSDECLWPDSIILSQYVGKNLIILCKDFDFKKY